MGVAANVGFEEFPRQGSFLNRRVKVCFNYDTSRTVGGVIVRDDAQEPGLLIIRLDDGRHVLATECQYRFDDSPPPKPAGPDPRKNFKLNFGPDWSS